MCKKSTKLKFKANGIIKIAVFETSKSAKNHFTQNLSGRKVLKFPYCVKVIFTFWKMWSIVKRHLLISIFLFFFSGCFQSVVQLWRGCDFTDLFYTPSENQRSKTMEGLPLNVPKSISGLLSFSQRSVSASLSRAEASLGLRTNGVPTTSAGAAAASTPGASTNGTPPPNPKPLSSTNSNTNSSVSSTSNSHQRLNNPSRYEKWL